MRAGYGSIFKRTGNPLSAIFLLILSSAFIRSADFEVMDPLRGGDYFRFCTTNNITLRGKTAEHYGDNANTGTLLLELKKDAYLYALNLTVYTQTYPELSEPDRVDVIEASYGKTMELYKTDSSAGSLTLLGQLILTGNFGGEVLQTTIHTLTDNAEIALPYSTDVHNTIGMTVKSGNLFYLNPFQYAFADMQARINIDGSGYAQIDIGTVRHYQWLEFKILTGIKYISPLRQELVEEVTTERLPRFAIMELGLNLGRSLILRVGSNVLGDNPYGNEFDNPDLPGKQKVKDPFSYLNLYYRF